MRLRALAASGGSARRYFGRKTLVAPLVALAVLTPAPAIAADGSDLIGHRCRTGDSLYTKENTVAALRDVSTVPGAMCEIDVWRLSDGTNIVWHDPTWERVADPATLPDGVDPTDPVTQATSAQVSQIRTKGGQPVARLGWMIRAAGEYDVPLIVEIQNSISGEEWFVDYARQQGATVSYYAAPKRDCSTDELDELRRAGATIGIKINDNTDCELTASQLASKGARFVTVAGSAVTSTYTDSLHARGISVYARWASVSQIVPLLNSGADRVMINDPLAAFSYLR